MVVALRATAVESWSNVCARVSGRLQRTQPLYAPSQSGCSVAVKGVSCERHVMTPRQNAANRNPFVVSWIADVVNLLANLSIRPCMTIGFTASRGSRHRTLPSYYVLPQEGTSAHYPSYVRVSLAAYRGSVIQDALVVGPQKNDVVWDAHAVVVVSFDLLV